MNFLRHGCIEHQIGEDMLCLAFLKPGDIILDVGANVGYTAMLYAAIAGDTGHVTAFEPSPRAFMHLSRNCANLGNVTCIQAAVSETSGEMRFYETESLDTSSLIPRDCVQDYIVPVVTVDEILENAVPPSFIKIDVEGHEHAVFRGMKTLLSQTNPPVILFEAASTLTREKSCDLIQELSQSRYTFHGILRNGYLCAADETEGMSNYLAWPTTRNFPSTVFIDGARQSARTHA